jgi:HSP20 family protein
MDTDNKGNVPVTTSKKSVPAANAWPMLQHPIAEVERAFDRFFGRSWPSMKRWSDFPVLDNLFETEGMRIPSLDVVDRENEVLVRAEMPGIEKKDINISLTDNQLTIKGESSKEEKEERGDYYRHEISSSSFARSVTVPANVDAAKTVANLKDGILEIKLPKTESSKRRNITVM